MQMLSHELRLTSLLQEGEASGTCMFKPPRTLITLKKGVRFTDKIIVVYNFLDWFS